MGKIGEMGEMGRMGRREEGNRIKGFSNLEFPSYLGGCYKS